MATFNMLSVFSVLLFAGVVLACQGSISSLSDVDLAVKCTTITLQGFTVPAGQGLILNLLPGTTVTMAGDISFGNKSWAGPLFTIIGTSITFNGNGHNFNGGGPFYWDGTGLKGLNSSIQKPDPMMRIRMSGTFQNVTVVNSPARVFSVSNPAPLLMTKLTVDNSQGDYPNNRSYGTAAGHNTDGFDVSGHDVTIQNCTVHNQDDCLAIGKGTNIIFDRNTCIGGHGISIGSIGSNVAVSGVIVTGNIITDSDQALRIKTIASATGSVVGNVTYSGNTAKGIRRFGVIIDQSYPSTLGTPGTGTIISNVNFGSPTSNIAVNSGAKQVAVNCGHGSCTGTWDWHYLSVKGGVTSSLSNVNIVGQPLITG